ncbi:MAG: bifunctional riboflavin kinase/FAD synthetase [Gemmataceae bacterium]
MSDDSLPLRLSWDEVAPASCLRGAVAVGNFDGVHRGHANLVAALQEQARAVGGPAVVLSFDPHPLQLLAPEKFQPMLMTPADRVRWLKQAGADEVVLLRTSRELLQLSGTRFFQRILRGGLAAKAVVEGFNFRFGRDRAGDLDLLQLLCRIAGLTFVSVPPFLLDGVPVSSSRVRNELLAGNVRAAARLLGRRHDVHGVVGTGAQRGRLLGFPTANLQQVETVLPGDGVYAVRATTAGTVHAGAANVGPNPTFGEQDRKLEVHLLDFSGDLYGQQLTVEFVERLRGTRPFPGPAELVEQLRRDVEAVRGLEISS